MKKIIGWILVLALILASSAAVFAASPNFSDLGAAHWSHANVVKMAQDGIIAGYPDGTFRPENTVTYGEFIKMVAATTGITVSERAPGENWAAPYHRAAQSAGYFAEGDISLAALDREIPRSYMALISSSVIKDESFGDYATILESIQDVTSKTQFDYHIARAYGMKIINGYPDQTFRPDGTLTRAEAATVIARIQTKLNGGEIQEPVVIPEPEIIPEPEQEPLIDTSRFDTSVPIGTRMFKAFNDDGDIGPELEEIKEFLLREFPQDGNALFEVTKAFLLKPHPEGKTISTLKRYVNGWPIQITRPASAVIMYVFPKDYENEYYDTSPGEINEFSI